MFGGVKLCKIADRFVLKQLLLLSRLGEEVFEMGDAHELSPGIGAKEGKVIKLVDGLVEEDFVVKVKVEMLAVGLFSYEFG